MMIDFQSMYECVFVFEVLRSQETFSCMLCHSRHPNYSFGEEVVRIR